MLRINSEPLDFDGKLKIEEVVVWTTTTTYIGRAFYGLTSAPLTSDPVWAIESYVEDTATKTKEKFRPISIVDGEVSQNYEFIRDNRASLTYV